MCPKMYLQGWSLCASQYTRLSSPIANLLWSQLSSPKLETPLFLKILDSTTKPLNPATLNQDGIIDLVIGDQVNKEKFPGHFIKGHGKAKPSPRVQPVEGHPSEALTVSAAGSPNYAHLRGHTTRAFRNMNPCRGLQPWTCIALCQSTKQYRIARGLVLKVIITGYPCISILALCRKQQIWI